MVFLGAFERLRQLLELIRFSHTLFALPFALFSACLAWRQNRGEGIGFRWQELAGVVLCMVWGRSLAMAFNRLVDHAIDSRNPRTAMRHLPSGVISRRAVIVFCAACAAAFLASTLLFLPNRWPLWLSAPVLLIVCGYSYAKRFTSLCHYWLGAALMLAPLAAWIAIRAALSWPPVLLGAAVFFWVGGFDIIYSCQDEQFDRSARLRSIPARWGVRRALRVALFSHVLMLLALLGLWHVADLGRVFLAGLVMTAALLAYEHSLVKPDNLARVNLAFFHVNALISVGLLVVGLADLLFDAKALAWPRF